MRTVCFARHTHWPFERAPKFPCKEAKLVLTGSTSYVTVLYAYRPGELPGLFSRPK